MLNSFFLYQYNRKICVNALQVAVAYFSGSNFNLFEPNFNCLKMLKSISETNLNHYET